MLCLFVVRLPNDKHCGIEDYSSDGGINLKKVLLEEIVILNVYKECVEVYGEHDAFQNGSDFTKISFRTELKQNTFVLFISIYDKYCCVVIGSR